MALTDDEMIFAKLATVPIPEDAVKMACILQKLAWFNEPVDKPVAHELEQASRRILAGMSIKESREQMTALGQEALRGVAVECQRLIEADDSLVREFNELWSRIKDRN